MKPTYTSGAEWLDGPALTEWLEARVPPEKRSEKWVKALRRRMREWRKGSMAEIYTVDEYLVRMGLHLTEIPDDFWCPNPKVSTGRRRATHCKRGHELKGDNLLKYSDGSRRCRACKRRNNRRRYARNK